MCHTKTQQNQRVWRISGVSSDQTSRRYIKMHFESKHVLLEKEQDFTTQHVWNFFTCHLKRDALNQVFLYTNKIGRQHNTHQHSARIHKISCKCLVYFCLHGVISVYIAWNPWNLSFRYIHCTGQFTPKMKANAELRLLSSLVWIDSGVVVSQHRLESFLIK